MTPRTLVVGDVQGCADELEDLLAAVAFGRGRDRLVMVGDLVNRGPKSLAVLRLARALDADVVLGNHELHLLATAAGLERHGRATFGDVLDAPDRDLLLDWLVDRPAPIVLVRDYVVVHAGLPPGFRVPDDAHDVNAFVRSTWTSAASLRTRVRALHEHPGVRTLTTLRYCSARGRVPADSHAVDPAGFEPWFTHRPPGTPIAFGHWARLSPDRARRADLRFLDSGCVYGRRLTGWLVEEDRLVSVPARRQYAPTRA